MVKATIIALTAILITGCNSVPTIKTETQEVLVPVAYCPAPPKVERPVLPIDVMTPAQIQSDGEVVKHLRATVNVLLNYAEILESVVDQYLNINTMSEDIRKQIEDKKVDVEKPKGP